MADISTYLKQILSAVYGEDVRQAIHDAIQQCYTDGSAVSDAVADIITDKVKSTVTEQIKEMLEDGTLAALEVETDTTLSVSGAAADAAAVGEAISDVKESIGEAVESVSSIAPEQTTFFDVVSSSNWASTEYVADYTSGSKFDSSGGLVSHSGYTLLNQYLPTNGYSYIYIQMKETNIRGDIVFYDEDYNVLSSTLVSYSPYTVPDGAVYFRYAIYWSSSYYLTCYTSLFISGADDTDAEYLPYEEYIEYSAKVKEENLPDIDFREIKNIEVETDDIIDGAVEYSKQSIVTVTPYNLFANSHYIEGLNISNSGYIIEDSDMTLIAAPMTAGETYYFMLEGQWQIVVYPSLYTLDSLPDQSERIDLISIWNTSSYTPEVDCYAYRAMSSKKLADYKNGELSYLTCIATTDPTKLMDTLYQETSNSYGIKYTNSSGGLVSMQSYPTTWIGGDFYINQYLKDAIRIATNTEANMMNSYGWIWFCGDSICYAASNAGMDCYRTQVSIKLDLRHAYTAVSGTCATHGYGSSWDSDDSDATGADGFISAIGSRTDGRDSINVKMDHTIALTLALGTNDFGNNAPLGEKGDTDTSTFYGGYTAIMNHLRENFPDTPIICILPFKRQNWNVENDAGCVLSDYCYAIADIAFDYDNVTVLDLFDKWYLDYDDEANRSKYFIDYVHITSKAHKMVATEIVRRIIDVVDRSGFIFRPDTISCKE